MDDLTERALKLLRESPDLIEEAEGGAPIWNSIAGNLLATETGRRRWETEKALCEALRLIKRTRREEDASAPTRWRDLDTTLIAGEILCNMLEILSNTLVALRRYLRAHIVQ
ncbi:MAG TPA: hypothetical protein VGL41_15945 [Roseiarcus sp.]|jgi:hypothetical protein